MFIEILKLAIFVGLTVYIVESIKSMVKHRTVIDKIKSVIPLPKEQREENKKAEHDIKEWQDYAEKLDKYGNENNV